MAATTLPISFSKPATDKIIAQQEQVKNTLPFDDDQDYEDVKTGFIATLTPNIIPGKGDAVVWNNDVYSFLNDKTPNEAPNEANPSLWRQSQLNATAGLYSVHDQIYQVRGLDLSNVTFVEGTTGVIVIDPLTSLETGQAAYKLYKEHRGNRPVSAIIYTHSHVDHFGGVKGFVTQEEVDAGIPVIAPEGFLEHAVAENVFTGTCMSRRAAYMYGAALERGVRGQIGAGLGQTTSTGVVTLIAPTDIITTTGESRTIDDVDIVFQMAPDTEAPAEMLFYFPKFKALCAAEDATHTFHNLLTLRGAVVRDPHGWARYLTETIDLFGDKTEVIFASHHWPTWGTERIIQFLTSQRDLYAYIHDQTLRLINKGFNGPEIAEHMVLPPKLRDLWSTRGYYGSISHNVKAVYQRYVGWFDGNPAHLWEHIPKERAIRYVALAGGIDQIISKGREAYEAGDFRWAAEIVNHAVFADDSHVVARNLLADIYEQMGYGAENGTWRNFFISGTTELRYGNFGTPTVTGSADVVAQLTPEMLFDSMAVQINGPEAWLVQELSIDVVLTDRIVPLDASIKNGVAGPPPPRLPSRYRLWLSNGALIYTTAQQSTPAQANITATTRTLPLLAVVGLDAAALAQAGIKVEDPSNALGKLALLLDPGDPNFNIVTP
ncbi:beta-lactamase-like protein [Xylariales sp. PMI_506]|nr:beta-lactamase-like protein [Xylariales sp. PMI_506]